MSFVNSKLLGSRKTGHWASWIQTEWGQEPQAPAFHFVPRTHHFSMPVTVIYVSSFSSNVHIYALLSNAEKGVYSYASQAPSPSGFLLGPAVRGTQRKTGASRRAGGLLCLADSVSKCPKGSACAGSRFSSCTWTCCILPLGVPEALTCLTHLGAQNPDLLCPSSPFFPSPRGSSFLQLLSLAYLRNFVVVVVL